MGGFFFFLGVGGGGGGGRGGSKQRVCSCAFIIDVVAKSLEARFFLRTLL